MPRQDINGPGFHHIAIRVRDFDATLRFYTEGLGFQRVYGWGKGDGRAAMLDTGGGNYLEVFAGSRRPVGEDAPEGAILHFAMRVPDTNAALARAAASGARVTMEPTDITIQGDHPLPVRIAFCLGPDGEVIEFFHNDEL
jgi:glyoxylase I family protein